MLDANVWYLGSPLQGRNQNFFTGEGGKREQRKAKQIAKAFQCI